MAHLHRLKGHSFVTQNLIRTWYLESSSPAILNPNLVLLS